MMINLAKKEKNNIDYSGKPLVPVRHMNFLFDAEEMDHEFYLKSEQASAFFEALSIFLTFGEDLVIDTARFHRDFVKDPVLKQRVTALIGQEAIHSKVHDEWNHGVLKEYNYPVELYKSIGSFFMENVLKKLPQPLKLSMTAGIEHFSAVLADFMMKREDYFFETQDEKQRAMWLWHMMEESEHKDIAYDLFQELSGNYYLRVLGFAIGLTIMSQTAAMSTITPLYRKPSKVFSYKYWKDAWRGAGLLFGVQNGVYGSSLGHIFDYLRPGFHPNDHDTRDYLDYYKEKLLNPDNGILVPYLTKEIIPAIRG